jgi:ubiquinone/menaquinone biosynthesis C-methylase UbiE
VVTFVTYVLRRQFLLLITILIINKGRHEKLLSRHLRSATTQATRFAPRLKRLIAGVFDYETQRHRICTDEQGKHILEIGCGRGVGVEILFGLRAEHVTAFDLDARMIARAQRRLTRYINRVSLFTGDVEAIDAPDASFEAVVDYGILHHVPDWRKAINEVARVLRPGGTFHFEEPFEALLNMTISQYSLDHPESARFSASEFQEALETAGLRITYWRQFGSIFGLGYAERVSSI